jgi:hypothetical protein
VNIDLEKALVGDKEALQRLAKALETPLRTSTVDLRQGSFDMKYFEALATIGKEKRILG